MQFARLPWPVYLFSGSGPATVFARFATKKEAEEFCITWQSHDPSNLYAISEDPDR